MAIRASTCGRSTCAASARRIRSSSSCTSARWKATAATTTSHGPIYEADVGRGARRSPLYATLANAGAVYGNKFGWERPNWFAAPGTPAIETPSFERGPAFDAIGAEHRAVRERVALIDMTSFSKYEVRGPGALALLQNLAVNDLDRPVGTIVYTQLCNERGGIEADVTITRLADDRFYFVTGSALGVRDRSTIERHVPADGSVDDLRSHVGARPC